MRLVELPRVVAEQPGRPVWGDAARPMQELTRSIALDDGAWTPERKQRIGALFDSLAPGWKERDAAARHDALADALARGGPFPSGWCLEVGSGTGNATADLRAAFGDVVSFDLSLEMLRLADAGTPRVGSDASALPVRAGTASVIALVNMFLFPDEVTRALADDGVLLWVSTNGDETPIYLPPDDVVAALPGDWQAVTSEAGWGTWVTARRARVGSGA